MSSEPAAKGTNTLRIGKYEVIRHIATGGMGAVYRARDVELDREVALKVLNPQMPPDKRVTRLERFRLEALNANRLRHPNIAQIYDCGGEKGIYWLALEFVDGPDLQEYIQRKGKLGFEESKALIIQAIKALNHLHKNGLVHRDVKPSNFLVTQKDGQPMLKLIDLGLSKRTDVPDDADFRVTKDGATLGTIDYMAPEQAKDSRKADVRSDIYSLGCTWFHMLAGKPLFPDGTLMERLYTHLQSPPPDIRQLNDGVPESAAAVLKRMLAKAPEDRYPTPAAILKDLDPKAGAKGEPVAPADLSAALHGLADDGAPGKGSEAGDPAAAVTTPPAVKRRTKIVMEVPAPVEEGPPAEEQEADGGPPGFLAALAKGWVFWLAVGAALVVVIAEALVLILTG